MSECERVSDRLLRCVDEDLEGVIWKVGEDLYETKQV